MASDGTVTLTDLGRRYFGVEKPCETRTERRKVLKAIRTFIEGVRDANLAAKGLERSHYRGRWTLQRAALQRGLLQGLDGRRQIWYRHAQAHGPILAKLGWYVAPHAATGIPVTKFAQVDSSGSEYEPSHPNLLSSAVFQLSPDAPLPPPAHYGLLSALNPKGRRRSVLAVLWDQAERLNFQAYRTWDDAQWAQHLSTLYARTWGYDPERLQRPLSFWPATPKAAGGVALLLHPDSALKDAVPWHQERWSAHFIAIQGKLEGEQVTVVCLYGPNAHQQREALFDELASLPAPTGTLLLGGDFNCHLDPEIDRSRRTRSPPSSALARLLEAWSLVDAVLDDMLAATTSQDVAAFHAAYHSYVYQYQDNALATARLDRWYTSRSTYAQIGSVITAPPVARSDHDSVTIEVYARAHKPRNHGRAAPQLRYPLPVWAADAITQCSRSLLASKGPDILTQAPQAAAQAWDDLKLDIRRQCLTVRRERLTLTNNDY